MSVDVASFVDTNVLVYAVVSDDPRRSLLAQNLLRELMAARALHTSTQVLAELFVTLTRKVRPALSSTQATRYVEQIAAWPVSVLDYQAIRQAMDLAGTKKLSFWDSLVLVAAARSGAKRLYTEDLSHGQSILGVEIVNPFRAK